MINSLDIYDNLAILIYFVLVFIIGLYVALRSDQNADEYFLAGRKMGWLVIGFSIFTTNISSEHIVGLSASGAERGLAVAHFEWMAVIFIVLLGYLIAPIFLKAKIKTVPEFIGEKFGVRTRRIFSGLSIFSYIFTKITITLFAGGILLRELLGWNFFTSSVIMLLFTGLYTIIGGLRSVMYTQVFQAVIFLISGFLVLFFGIEAVGGLDNLWAGLPEGHLTLFQPLSDPDFPWLGIIIGAPILAIWYWWSEQYIVQRILSARNIKEAKKGSIFGSVLKVFPFFLFIIAGMIAFVLTPSVEGINAYASLLKSEFFPAGVKGIIISGFFAALMSSLASAFNSTSTLVAYDFFDSSRRGSSSDQLVLVGRITTVLLVFASILFIPIISLLSSNLYINLQSLQAYISPPIVVVFLHSFLKKRISSVAAICTLIIGECIGLLRLIGSYTISNPDELSGVIAFFMNLNYLYFAGILFVFSMFTYHAVYAIEKRVLNGHMFSKFYQKFKYGANAN